MKLPGSGTAHDEREITAIVELLETSWLGDEFGRDPAAPRLIA